MAFNWKRIDFKGVLKEYKSSPVVFRARLARLVAKLIDATIFGVFTLIPSGIGFILGCLYLATSDSFFSGESFGKKLLGIRVIDLNEGTPCSLRQSVVRNLPILLPLAFSFIGGWSWGLTILALLPLTALETFLIMKIDAFHRVGDILAETTVIGNDPHCEKQEEQLQYLRWKEQDQSLPIH